MQPIHELLHRIQWDPEFGQGRFELAFLDRTTHDNIRLPFANITFVPGEHYFFHYQDAAGNEHSVPLHRIKAVYKNDERIWHREH
jgi:uncharacterized protein (UPF0248 family)